MQYLCEKTKNGRKISRVFGYDSIVEIPECLMGEQVTELGDYVFSDRMDPGELEEMLRRGNLCTEEGKIAENVDKFPEIAGSDLEELILPQSIEKTGRYAFYNCRNLKKISFGGALRDLGAGALTGCHQISELTVRLGENDCSCLREILTEIPETLCVKIEKKDQKGCFWFPEFFEEGVENTPARILENHVHGSGIRYRNCFQNRVLNTGEYDEIFPYAIAWEKEQVALRLALGRVLFPLRLTEKAEEKYLVYLREHSVHAAELLGREKEYHLLEQLLELLKPDRETMEQLLETAQKQEDPRWTGILMERLGGLGRKKRRSFEL